MYEGTDMDLKEEYICDKCNTPLTIKAVVSFKVEQAKDFFDDDSYVSVEKLLEVTIMTIIMQF